MKPVHNPSPFTSIEIIEQVPEGTLPGDRDRIAYNYVLINGRPVRVAPDGIAINYDAEGPKPSSARLVVVSLELIVDEFRIHRVAPGYIQKQATLPWGSTGDLEQSRTIIEVIEELHPKQPADKQPGVKYNQVLINGRPVRIAADGMMFDFGRAEVAPDWGSSDREPPARELRITVELIVDEFRIRRVHSTYVRQQANGDWDL